MRPVRCLFNVFRVRLYAEIFPGGPGKRAERPQLRKIIGNASLVHPLAVWIPFPTNPLFAFGNYNFLKESDSRFTAQREEFAANCAAG
jgi:hypothetical protein